MGKNQVIPEMILSSAQGFYQLGVAIAASIGQDKDLIQKLAPAMVNFSFSIELLLKALLMSTGKKVGGHSILKLYNGLDPLERKTISDAFTSTSKSVPDNQKLPDMILTITDSDKPKEPKDGGIDLTSLLAQHDESFVQWRYFFEYGTDPKIIYANFHFMECFARSIISVLSVKGLTPVSLKFDMPFDFNKRAQRF